MSYQTTNLSIDHHPIKKLTDQQEEILFLIQQSNYISTLELRNKLSFSPSERWVRDALSKLKKQGYIDAMGQTTARKWFINKK